MVRRGVRAEYEAKKKLGKLFNLNRVWKLAPGQKGPDFVVFKDKKVFFVEVKSRKGKYTKHTHDVDQWDEFKWINKCVAPVEYFLKTSDGWELMSYEDFGRIING